MNSRCCGQPPLVSESDKAFCVWCEFCVLIADAGAQEYFARLERLLLQNKKTLPISFGVMSGLAFGFLFI